MVTSFLDGLEKRAIDYAKKIISQTARYARDDLVEAYKVAIDRFYAEYTPTKYVRHEERGMGRGLANTYRKIYKNPHGLIAYAGIEFISDNMPSDYNDPASVVLFEALYGFHGRWGPQGTPMLDRVLQQCQVIETFAQQYVDRAVASVGSFI